MHIVQELLKVALLGSAWVLYLLIALSVVSIAATLERWVFLRRNAERGVRLRDDVKRFLLEGDIGAVEARLATSRSIEARVLHAALAWRSGGADAVSDAIESELGTVRGDLERSTNLLGTLGNNAPFIGLFGTVIGVIQAFSHLGVSGARAGAMGNVMSGIAEALVATGVGIFVAIPAVVAYNVAQKKIADIEGNTYALGKLLTAYIKTEEHAGHPVRSSSKRSVGAEEPHSTRTGASDNTARRVRLAIDGAE